jgi:hypothetical protein
MLNKLFSIPANHKVLFLVLIPFLAFVLCYSIFPILLRDYYENAFPEYVLLDTINVSRNLFWLFETVVFYFNLWIYTWKIRPAFRYSLMGFVFLIGWLITITDFRYPTLSIVAGTGFMCAFYYLLVPIIKLFFPPNEVN